MGASWFNLDVREYLVARIPFPPSIHFAFSASQFSFSFSSYHFIGSAQSLSIFLSNIHPIFSFSLSLSLFISFFLSFSLSQREGLVFCLNSRPRFCRLFRPPTDTLRPPCPSIPGGSGAISVRTPNTALPNEKRFYISNHDRQFSSTY